MSATDTTAGGGEAGRARAPAFFVSHGSPMVALDSDAYTRALRAFGESAGPVRARVVVSAHWETHGEVRVTAAESPELIYDFGGFPEPLYRLKYPARGAPELARDIVRLLRDAGVGAALDAERGWDHGTWIPLRLAWPEPGVTPVVQVSLPRGASAAQVARMGRALRPLRAEGVLLIGSGSLTHNLRQIDLRNKLATPAAWAQSFEDWMMGKLAAGDFAGMESWRDAPNSRLAHPSDEHLLPLFFVLGAALPEDRVTPVYEGFHHASLSMRSFALRG